MGAEEDSFASAVALLVEAGPSPPNRGLGGGNAATIPPPGSPTNRTPSVGEEGVIAAFVAVAKQSLMFCVCIVGGLDLDVLLLCRRYSVMYEGTREVARHCATLLLCWMCIRSRRVCCATAVSYRRTRVAGDFPRDFVSLDEDNEGERTASQPAESSIPDTGSGFGCLADALECNISGIIFAVVCMLRTGWGPKSRRVP